jgi:hypothetical protein
LIVLTNCDEQEMQQSENAMAASNNQIQVEETTHVPKSNDEIQCQNETEQDGALGESAMTTIINKIQVEETINVPQSDKQVVKKVIIDCTDDEVNQIRDVEDGLQPSDTGNNY